MLANDTHLQKRQLRGLAIVQTSQPLFYPQEVDEAALPGNPCQAHDRWPNNVVSMIFQGNFMLNITLNSSDESTWLVDEGNIICLGFREVFDIPLHGITHTYGSNSAKGRESVSFQWCWGKRQEAVGTHWNTGDCLWTSVNVSLLSGWLNHGTDCPERLWSLDLWRH